MFVYYVAAILVALVLAYSAFRPALCSLYKKGFAHFIHFMTPAMNKLLITYKLDAFARLHDAKAKGGLKILEIGTGTGANFEFLPTGSTVICVEPSVHMHRILYENYEKFRNIINIKVLNVKAEDMTGVADDSMDAVIATCVLCSVNDLGKCIAEAWRVLKPGGYFCYVEHTVDSNKTTWTYASQKLVNVIWSFLCDGCDTFSDPQPIIDAAGFSDISYKTAYLDTRALASHRLIYGVAVK